MKNYRGKFRLMALALFMCIFSSLSLAQYDTEEEHGGPREEVYDETKEDAKKEIVEVRNKLSPVSLEKITTGDTFTYTYKGKTYRFSSSKAIEEFKKDPEKYLKEWEKKERFYKINIIYD